MEGRPDHADRPGAAGVFENVGVDFVDALRDLDRQHPYYTKVIGTWNQVATLNAGGWQMKEDTAKYLRKRPTEPGETYMARKDAASYTPLLGNVTGWYDSALWKQPPAFDISPESDDIKNFREEWEKDVTRTGVDFRRFFKGIVEAMLINKFAYVLIDMPESDGDVVSQADQYKQKLLNPLLIEYKPQAIINWGEDRFGGLEWAVVKTFESRSVFAGKPINFDVWTFYDSQVVCRYTRLCDDTNLPLVAQRAADYPKAHPLSQRGKMPLYRFSVPDGLWFGNRIVSQLIKYYNMDNALDWSLENSCLAQLAVKGQYGNASSAADPRPVVSETSWHQLAPDGHMFYVEPEGKAAVTATVNLEGKKEQIYRDCYLVAQARTNRSTPTAQSGISKIQDQQPANDALSGIGDVIRPALEVVYNDVFALRFGGQDISVNVRGFEFNSKAVDRIEIIDAASTIEVNSPTYQRRVSKEIVRVVFEDESPDWLAEVDAEIDANPTAQEAAAAQAEQQKQMQLQGMQKFQKTLNKIAPAA